MRASPVKLYKNPMKFYYKQKSDGEMIDTPCAADRSTRTIYINPKLFKKLSIFEKKFWIWHEKGHIILNTSDEIKADTFAFNKLAGTEYRSLKQMIEAAENLLNPNSPYHQERIDNLYKLAIKYDMEHPILNKTIGGDYVEKTGDAVNKNIQSVIAGMIGISNATSNAAKSGSQTSVLGTTLSTSTIIILAIVAFVLLKND